MTLNAAFHCGAVRFTVTLSDGVNTARRCDCSLCAMRGAVAISAPLDGITIQQGEDNLTLYSFNTHVAQHYFCKTCGIYTHHKRRSNPTEYGVNIACLDGFDPFLPAVDVLDGLNHPQDGQAMHRRGVLRFEADAP
ncbi:GFA family protein [Maribius pontilimi]|uniref:GFA family protein n=1 Tax=Palleronia pontilimi TaxID=1964209 RepID=A0A934MEX6_9RHOB|nr:GFA family protein [Palleronia pontilimi]MBJ3763906.1 GFA family protein [Palleronia pontilimi]